MATIVKTARDIQEGYNEYYNGYGFGNKAYAHSYIYIENKSKKYMLVGIKEVTDKLEFTLAYKEDVIIMEYGLSDKIKFDITDKINSEYYKVIEKYYGLPINIIQLIKQINTRDAKVFDKDIIEIARGIRELTDETKSYVFGWVDYIGEKNDIFIMYPFAAQQVFYRFCLEAEIEASCIKTIPSYVWLIYETEIEDYIEEEMVHYIDPHGVLESKYRMMGNSIYYLSDEMQIMIADVILSDIKDYVCKGIIQEEMVDVCIKALVEEMSITMEIEESVEMVPGMTIH